MKSSLHILTLDGARPEDIYSGRGIENPAREAKTVPFDIERRYFKDAKLKEEEQAAARLFRVDALGFAIRRSGAWISRTGSREPVESLPATDPRLPCGIAVPSVRFSQSERPA